MHKQEICFLFLQTTVLLICKSSWLTVNSIMSQWLYASRIKWKYFKQIKMMEFSFMTGNSIFKLLEIIKDLLGENLYTQINSNMNKNSNSWLKNILADLTVFQVQGFWEELHMTLKMKMIVNFSVHKLSPKSTKV